jgi:hypothetical protein
MPNIRHDPHIRNLRCALEVDHLVRGEMRGSHEGLNLIENLNAIESWAQQTFDI